jgi:signal transduction histidine kinase
MKSRISRVTNKKLIAVFLLLTAVPVGLLGWLAVVGYRSEAERTRQQLEALGRERLTTVNLQIEHHFSSLESELLGLPNLYEAFTRGAGEGAGAAGTAELRELTRENFLFRQVFILDSENRMLFPDAEMPLSENERDFLLRTKEIGLSRGLFENSSEKRTGTQEYGWYTWYLGEGINFIFWQKGEQKGGTEQEKSVITAVELNRMAVISGVIRGLPATDPKSGDRFRVVLKDVGNNEVYIWGSYVPEEGIPPTATASVVPPLAAWSLEYYLPPGTEEAAAGRIIPLFGVIGFVSLAIIGLAVYFYRESRREVREAYKKVSFVNQVSHELKTPLTNIRMYAELLENRLPEEDERGSSYLDIVISESRRLGRLIGNVLTFAREGQNGAAFSPSEEVPDRIVQAVVGNFRASLESKKIHVELDLHAGTAVMIDRDITEQIVSNLISNVEKYAASGEYLGIQTKQYGQTAKSFTTEITVVDKGPGIPKGLREKVFSPFFRISSKSTDGISGTGIGLSIVRGLAKKHGGSAAVISGGGPGTELRVVLKTERGQNENTVS